MDNDISHAVEERLAAIELRLDALENGGNGEDGDGDDDETVEPLDEEPAPAATSSRRGRKQKDTVEESYVDTTTTEWSS